MASRWDEKTQTPHGGQDWRELKNFVEDFSVTTNGLGYPSGGLKAAAESLHSIHHYPPADAQPALSNLATFLFGKKANKFEKKLILGNGASELIDLCIRSCKHDNWRTGPFEPQYMEYERNAIAAGKVRIGSENKPGLIFIVNPCNPTGEFLDVEALKKYMQTTAAEGSRVLVDESMLPWLGPKWRSQSLVSQNGWMEEILISHKIEVFVIHSWTKLWACPGIRIGSVVAPTPEIADGLKKVLIPWSVNSMALAFIAEAVKDEKYLEKTWEVTPKWRAAIVDPLKVAHPDWTFYGELWTPFVWIDVHDAKVAEECVAKTKAKGFPIRFGKAGYNRATCIRIGVRDPVHSEKVVEALA